MTSPLSFQSQLMHTEANACVQSLFLELERTGPCQEFAPCQSFRACQRSQSLVGSRASPDPVTAQALGMPKWEEIWEAGWVAPEVPAEEAQGPTFRGCLCRSSK